jgi:hypothetical protein
MRSTILILIVLLMVPVLAYSQQAGIAIHRIRVQRCLAAEDAAEWGQGPRRGLIGDVEADPVHEIAEMQKGTTRMLWLNVSTGKDPSGVTGWRVLDVLSFPKLSKTDYTFFAGDPGVDCRRHGKAIPNVVGIGRIMRRQGVFRPSKLWVANLTTKKFERLAIAGVKCEYSQP